MSKHKKPPTDEMRAMTVMERQKTGLGSLHIKQEPDGRITFWRANKNKPMIPQLTDETERMTAQSILEDFWIWGN